MSFFTRRTSRRSGPTRYTGREAAFAPVDIPDAFLPSSFEPGHLAPCLGLRVPPPHGRIAPIVRPTPNLARQS